MSEPENEKPETGSIPDEALPEDLVPSDDNPLAQGLPVGETVESLRQKADQEADAQKGPDDES